MKPVRPPMGIPKPKKRDRPGQIRKRRITRLDRKVSKETETWFCEVCKTETKTDPAHKRPRRFQDTRHDPKNMSRKCRHCHRMEHDHPPKVKTYNVFR